MPKFDKNIEKSHEKEFNRAKQLFSLQKYKKAEKLLLRCYNYYKGKNKLGKAYEALDKYIICLIHMGYHQKALPKVNEFLEYSTKIHNEKYMALAYGTKGIIYNSTGNFDKALELAKQGNKLFKKLENYEDLIKSYINIGNSYYYKGKYEHSINNYEKAVVLCLQNNLLSGLAVIYQKIAYGYLALNNLEKFREYDDKIFEYLDQVSDPERQVELMNNLCIPPFYTKEASDTLQHFLLNLLEDCKKQNLNTHLVKTLENLAGIAIKQGNYPKAQQYFDQALKLSESLGYEVAKAYIFHNLADLSYKKGDLKKVIKNLKVSLEISKKHSIVPLVIVNHTFFGKIYKKENAYEKSYHNYREALDYYQKISGDISSVEQKAQFRALYQQLPQIIEELNNFIDSREVEIELEELLAIQHISKIVCSTANKQFNNFIREECKREFDRWDILIDRLMEEKLESDARKLFRKRYKYEIEDSGRDFRLEPQEIDLLFDKKCLKDKNSKTTEIDIFGEKRSDHTYILGECTYKAQGKINHKIRCFFSKATIISAHLFAHCEKFYQVKPRFQIVFISMKGFPEYDKITQLRNDNLRISNSRISDIEYIDATYFISLLKEYHIKTDIYEKYLKHIAQS